MDLECHKHVSFNCPKAELHIHIEGSIEPELVIKLSKKYNSNKYESIEELKEKYNFTCLKDFLDLYYSCCDILRESEDFEELMLEYLKKASSQGLAYAEIFFDPQTHTNRNVSFSTVITGLYNGIQKGKELYGVEANLIMCFLRDLSEEEAIMTLNQSIEFKDKIIAVGLDSNEYGNPPEKFKNVYELASKIGYNLVAHAGEECSIDPICIKNTIDILKVQRIDHGVQIKNSNELMKEVAIKGIPLTICPISNIKLKVFKNSLESPIIDLMKIGIIVTINSDDPSYFGGYIGDNYFEIGFNFNLSKEEYKQLAINSFNSSFLSKEKKEEYITKVDIFFKNL